MALIHCTECNRKISDQAAACPGCGVPVALSSATSPMMVTAPKSRSLTILLALLGGWIGLHKFYLNRPDIGIWYMIFFWTGVPLILGIIEGLSYLSISDQAFQKKYEDGLKKGTQKTSSAPLVIRNPNEPSPVWGWAGWALLFMVINAGLSVTFEASPNASIFVLPTAAAMTLGIRWLYKKRADKAKI